jgi:hypothetical protein
MGTVLWLKNTLFGSSYALCTIAGVKQNTGPQRDKGIMGSLDENEKSHSDRNMFWKAHIGRYSRGPLSSAIRPISHFI